MMNRTVFYVLAGCLLMCASCCSDGGQCSADGGAPAGPVVCIRTNMGSISVKLYADKAPVTVRNFLTYVNDGFYDGLIFHRVINGFMIQGGGHTPDLALKPTREPIVNEAALELKHLRGTITMARAEEPDSATSQFTINHVDNPHLNFDGPYAPGYVVFGKVIDGMDVVDAIAAVPVRQSGEFQHLPVEPVMIESVNVVK